MNRRKLLKAISLTVAVGTLIFLVCGWISFQYIPEWYDPLMLTTAEVESVRLECEATFDLVSTRMAIGEEFTVALNGRQMNEVLAAQSVIWPSAGAWRGRAGLELCTQLRENHLNVGGVYHAAGTQSVLNFEVSADIKNEQLCVTIDRIRSGSLPLPFATNWLIPELREALDIPDARSPVSDDHSWIADLLKKLHENNGTACFSRRFIWPNGHVEFELLDIAINNDILTLKIQPLSRPERTRGSAMPASEKPAARLAHP